MTIAPAELRNIAKNIEIHDQWVARMCEDAADRIDELEAALRYYAENCSGPGLEREWMRTPTNERALVALKGSP